MKIMLVEAPWGNTLIDGSSRVLPALGLGYLASALRKTRHECCVVNLSITGEIDQIGKVIYKDDVKVIGISCTTDTFREGIKIARYVKENFVDMTVIIGGVHVTVTGGETILNNWPNEFDFAIEGEGEEALPALLDAIEGNEEIDIPGVAYFKHNKIHKKPYELIKNLDEIEFPDRQSLRPPQHYEMNAYGLDVSLITSRGCSHNCSFCSVAKFYRHSWRVRSIENVLLEVEDIVALYGEQFFLHFIDDNFFVDEMRAVNIIEGIHKKWPLIVFSFATRSDQIVRSVKQLPRLREMGVVSIELGIENGSLDVLRRYGKNSFPEINKKAIEVLRENKIEIGVDYIFFDHYMAMNELRENLEFLKRSGLWGYYPPVVYTSLTLYPGIESSRRWQEEQKKEICLDKGTPIEFLCDDVKLIYDAILSLSKFQPRIFKIMKCCRKQEEIGSSKCYHARLIAKRISLLPYELLETLYMSVLGHKSNVLAVYVDEAIDVIEDCEKIVAQW